MRRVIAGILFFVFLSSACVALAQGPAAGIVEEQASPQDVLVGAGYPAKLVDEMDEDHVAELAERCRRDPGGFALSVSYLALEADGTMVPCGTSSDCDLIFAQTVVSDEPDAGVSYTVAIDFLWADYRATGYPNEEQKDRIALKWDGNLYLNEKTAYARYNARDTGAENHWGELVTRQKMEYTITTINGASEYSFPLHFNSSTASAQYGSILFQLEQPSAPVGTEPNVRSQYVREMGNEKTIPGWALPSAALLLVCIGTLVVKKGWARKTGEDKGTLLPS